MFRHLWLLQKTWLGLIICDCCGYYLAAVLVKDSALCSRCNLHDRREPPGFYVPP